MHDHEGTVKVRRDSVTCVTPLKGCVTSRHAWHTAAEQRDNRDNVTLCHVTSRITPRGTPLAYAYKPSFLCGRAVAIMMVLARMMSGGGRHFEHVSTGAGGRSRGVGKALLAVCYTADGTVTNRLAGITGQSGFAASTSGQRETG